MIHPLDKVFDVATPTYPQILPDTPVVEQPATGNDLSDDFELARKTIKETITSTQSAMTELLLIAQSSQHPRSFEVLATLAATMNGLSKQLVDLHKAKASVQDVKGDKNPQGGTNITNAVFVGSTEDLLKMISGKKAE